MKVKDSSKRVSYKRFPPGPSACASDAPTDGLEDEDPEVAAKETKSRPRLKAKLQRGAADEEEAQAAMQLKLDEHLARPFSAFALFGLAQRGVLKKQKSSADVKEIIKVVGGPRPSRLPHMWREVFTLDTYWRLPPQGRGGYC